MPRTDSPPPQDPSQNSSQESGREIVPEPAGIFHRSYLLVTLGACALVFLAAFESLAVTTIMPLVSRELDGSSLYALAFAGPLATGVIGMVAAGGWSDRRGPVAPLLAAVGMFVLGLFIAGTAGTMPVLVSGRLVQGLGGGGLTVALYVVIARVYPPVLHPKIFAAFSAAWVIPSLVGPFAAGAVAQVAGWQWVFLGVVGLVVPALLLTAPALRGLHGTPAPAAADLPAPAGPAAADPAAARTAAADPAAGGPAAGEASAGENAAVGADAGTARPPGGPAKLALAALAALAVLGLNLSAGVPGAGGVLAGVAVAVALLAVRPLMPRGTLTARRGLPSVILTQVSRPPPSSAPKCTCRTCWWNAMLSPRPLPASRSPEAPSPGPPPRPSKAGLGPGWSTEGRCGSARRWSSAPSSSPW